MSRTNHLDQLDINTVIAMYRDYNDSMANGFNGTPYPPEFPRTKQKPQVSYRELEEYVQQRMEDSLR